MLKPTPTPKLPHAARPGSVLGRLDALQLITLRVTDLELFACRRAERAPLSSWPSEYAISNVQSRLIRVVCHEFLAIWALTVSSWHAHARHAVSRMSRLRHARPHPCAHVLIITTNPLSILSKISMCMQGAQRRRDLITVSPDIPTYQSMEEQSPLNNSA